MRAIGGDELMRWEKMQNGMIGCEEKIVVFVRLRPLSEKEITRNEDSDWECISENTILYRNSLQERSGFPISYTFDRVFRGDCSTRQVYEEGTKEIALSVVNGINSTIFAYGQTSSGKTYTMMGITHYTVGDIYNYIQRHEERAFVLKFSAMEIYNEAVRDLLSSDSTPLRLLDDPERGTSIEKLTVEILRDWSHLKELLSICEAQRRTGETFLNEKSSRSHQIIRLTVESSACEFLGKDNSTTLTASVNFVDLAGSERASQALSAGARLKEGCHINRSLLTLGTVIRKLSNGRHGHVNYRDSKLTRILQPSLGGNARTAIVCTLSPARSHVEQSRNTLLFASCAKEVTTNAQVNVVMSDKALVKHLQRELARLESELRSPAPTSACDFPALLRKKDLQIEKMEKDIRELTKQRDLAQSRVEDLLQIIGNAQPSEHWNGHFSDDTSSPYLNRKPFVRDACRNPDKFAVKAKEDHAELCKEVRCIEISGCKENGNPEFIALSTGGDESTPREDRVMAEMLSSRRLKSSWSGKANLLSSSSSPGFDSVEQSGKTPPDGHEKEFPGRPEHIQRKFPPSKFGENYGRLSRNDSQSSMGSASIDELKAHNMKNSADEDIPSIHTFVAGMKEMAQLQYEKQVVDDIQAGQLRKNVRDVGLSPMEDSPGASSKRLEEFERQQREIVELWQACNVSLVHRTYFFLLFKGDPIDSIYMEVELRRLTFLKETFSQRNGTTNPNQTVTLASSTKAINRERRTLSKLMRKTFSEEERKALYQRWGIGLDSKRRRLQLVRRLWSDTGDPNRIAESAEIVGKLIRFSEQGRALKEMFGLSFTRQCTRRKSHGWKNSGASLLSN